MTETEIMNELKKIHSEVTEIRETLVALKMGVIGFDSIDKKLKDIERKIR